MIARDPCPKELRPLAASIAPELRRKLGLERLSVEGQWVFRQVQTSFGARDLPSKDKLAQALLDHSFLIRLKGTLYQVLEMQGADTAGVSVKVLVKEVVAPAPVLLAPDEPWPGLPPVVGP